MVNCPYLFMRKKKKKSFYDETLINTFVSINDINGDDTITEAFIPLIIFWESSDYFSNSLKGMK